MGFLALIIFVRVATLMVAIGITILIVGRLLVVSIVTVGGMIGGWACRYLLCPKHLNICYYYYYYGGQQNEPKQKKSIQQSIQQ